MALWQQGMQRNPNVATIQDALLDAMEKAEVLRPEFNLHPAKGDYKCASRTDKGVHAARMVRLCMGMVY